jgi:hypothetical protein
MYPDPFLVTLAYLVGRIRQRIGSALDGHPESGGLSLEWIVIASLLTIAAVGVGAFITIKITSWENNVSTP